MPVLERPDDTVTDADGTIVRGEPRWAMALAVVVLMGLAIEFPHQAAIVPALLLATLEGVLLAALIIGDPGRIDRDVPWIHRASIALFVVILVSTAGSTILLVYDLLLGAPITNDAVPLLLAGGRGWIQNNVAFALVYWMLDGGGPAVRLRGLRPYPDFAFPQTFNPEVAPPGWRPHFVDYLYLAFTNANSFSPTDTMPLVPWAKVAMGIQAMISFVIIGLVLARAVGVFN